MGTLDGQTSKAMHTLCLENRSQLKLTGIEDVISFDENGLLLQTSLGTLTVDGSDIHIVLLSVEKGELAIEGHICGLYYVDRTTKKSGFFVRKSDK